MSYCNNMNLAEGFHIKSVIVNADGCILTIVDTDSQTKYHVSAEVSEYNAKAWSQTCEGALTEIATKFRRMADSIDCLAKVMNTEGRL